MKTNFYVDSLTHDPNLVPALIDIFGGDKIVYGTDYPFPLGEVHGCGMYENSLPGEALNKCSLISVDQKEKIFVKNAFDFLNLPLHDFK